MLQMDVNEAMRNEATKLQLKALMDGSFEVANLPAGDFAGTGLPMTLGIERKSWPNLFSSLTSPELADQLTRLSGAYEVAVLLIEDLPRPDDNGVVRVYGTKRGIPYAFVMKALLGWFGRGVWPLCVSRAALVPTIIQLYRACESGTWDTRFRPRHSVPDMLALSDRDATLLSLPGLGPERLRKLEGLSIAALALQEEETWQEQLGPKTGSTIYKALHQQA